MAQQKDIEIKNTTSVEVTISTKKTLYVCISWQKNGLMFASSPTEDKRYAEEYAFGMSKYDRHTCIYKFDIDVPNFKDK